MIDRVPAQQHDAEVLAQVSPRGVTGSSLWHEHSHHALIAEALKLVRVVPLRATGAVSSFGV
jgi:hypothetical protein